MKAPLSQCIRVLRSSSSDEWIVSSSGALHASFVGRSAKGRAIAEALGLAEELRADGGVVVLVDDDRRDRLAS